MKYLANENKDQGDKSLPSWERGLKLLDQGLRIGKKLSLPSWERGLKYLLLDCGLRRQESLPSWERGLKCLYQKVVSHETGRSPRGSVD